MPETCIITIKYTPATPIPLQGMGETAPGAWQHHTYPLPPPSTLLGALAAPHLRHAKGATREEKLRNALAHAGIKLKAARAVYATINTDNGEKILLSTQNFLIFLQNIIDNITIYSLKHNRQDITTDHRILIQNRIHAKLTTRTETPGKQVDENIGGLYQKNYISPVQYYQRERVKLEIYLDLEVEDAAQLNGITRLPKTPVRYETLNKSKLLEKIQNEWGKTRKALLYVATPILLKPSGETPLQLIQRFKDEIIRAARLQREGLQLNGPYSIIEGEKPEIRPLFPGFNQADRRREPLYTALMPGAAYIAEGVDPDNWRDIYTAKIGEKTYLGYGVLIPLPVE